MTRRVLSCPSCGAPLPAADRAIVVCEYCGSTTLDPDGRGQRAAEKPGVKPVPTPIALAEPERCWCSEYSLPHYVGTGECRGYVLPARAPGGLFLGCGGLVLVVAAVILLSQVWTAGEAVLGGLVVAVLVAGCGRYLDEGNKG